jgi:hypothetical protein
MPGVEPRSEAASVMLISVIAVFSVTMGNTAYFVSLKALQKESQENTNH